MEYYKGNPEGGLSPITSKWMHQLFEDQEILKALVEKYGSPINIHHLPTFAQTIASFQDVFQSYGIKHQIFYARKANKCKSLVKQAFASGIGVDTASYNELKQSIALGGNGGNVVLTAAIKTKDQIELAVRNGVAIILDNVDECMLTDSIAKELGVIAKVGIRISGFQVDGKKLYSRFGFDVEKAGDFIQTQIGAENTYSNLLVTGLHFHLDGYSTFQRASGLSASIALAKNMKDQGYPIRFIDIGGGILMNYLESEKQWQEFDLNLRTAVKNNHSNLTFNGNGLGYQLIDGELMGELKTYPYYNKVSGEKFLREILDYSDSETRKSNAQRLIEEELELRIEPGRSLLNQTGITVAKVAHRKKDSKGQWLIGLEMNMSQMMSSSTDFLLDPFVMYAKQTEPQEMIDAFFTGAYCLERDILLKRMIKLPKLPEIGDLVAFVNTAGYMMHFFETEAHLFELSTNLSFSDTPNWPTVLDFLPDEFIEKASVKFI
ncbi:type III PLP-dependent enzyme domain-containing protein [Sediminicola luteus]|uniref:Y4yA family PLP-dependent enzyme n=1 Tax=Sediminicola luteus TaxID=319238 RepID=A0ABV2TTP9_9FLAO